jgi:hypothetical protein
LACTIDAGKQVVAGARFYVQQHGDTVAGKKIELIVKDDTTAFDVGKRLVQELIVNKSWTRFPYRFPKPRASISKQSTADHRYCTPFVDWEQRSDPI